jgi:hypothetical protein
MHGAKVKKILGLFLGIRRPGRSVDQPSQLVELLLHFPFVPSRDFTDRTSLFASFHTVTNKDIHINNIFLIKNFLSII